MTVTAAGFPGQVTDVEWSQILSLLGWEGATGFTVSAVAGDRTVSVAAGLSNVGGVLATNDGAVTIQANPNGGSHSRIDSVILRADWPSEQLTLMIRQGAVSSNPQPPALDKNAGVRWELRLANLTVAPGQGAFTGGNVEDTRTPPQAGFYQVATLATAPEPAVHPALIYYTPTKSIRIGTPSGYVEVAHARGVEHGCGGPIGVTFDGNGNTSVQHNLGWVPTYMGFIHDATSATGAVVFYIRNLSSVAVSIHARNLGSGTPYTGGIGSLRWTAQRNV